MPIVKRSKTLTAIRTGRSGPLGRAAYRPDRSAATRPKLKSSDPTALSRKLSALVRLNTSTSGSMMVPLRRVKRREKRISQVKKALSRRSVLRVRIVPSAQMRSDGCAARMFRVAHDADAGEADR